MLDVVSRVPAELAKWVPADVSSLGTALGAAPVSTPPEQWFDVAQSIASYWSDGVGNAAVSSCLAAAEGASEVFLRKDVIDSTVSQGVSAIDGAIADIAGIATEFLVQAGVTSCAGLASGPSGIFGVQAQLQSLAASALAQAHERMSALAQQLAQYSDTLEATAHSPVSIPEPPELASGDGSHDVAGFGTMAETTAPPPTGADADAATDASATDTDSPTVSGAPTPEAAAAVQHALSAVGTPYQWGGNQPGVGLDCSGLTHWAYGQAGVEIPRTAAEQAVGRQVQADELLPGDLVVWEGHVAMVVGDGQMVEAGDPVKTNPIRTENSGMAFYGYYRPTG